MNSNESLCSNDHVHYINDILLNKIKYYGDKQFENYMMYSNIN
jgi:hypothetical protein